jgi:hypothetical protein
MVQMKVRISLSQGFFPLLFSSLMILSLVGCAQENDMSTNGEKRQLSFSVTTSGWNSLGSSFSPQASSRALPISGTTFDTSKSFNMIADENRGGSWSTEINNETVSYSTTNNIWQTSGAHFWPGTGNIVNFYAYYPASISSSISHTAGSSPVLSYTVPDDAADQTDILASSETGVAGDSYIQTSVDFNHIFAAVQFSVGSSGLPDGTITKITLNNIQYKGTYSLDGTWTQDVTDKKSFSQTVSTSTSAGTVITSGSTTFMMMPQTLGSDASITVTYSNGGILTKAISGTWEAGKTYTYNLSKIIPVANFDYTGGVQSYTVPLSGTYKLEVWGAQGGNAYWQNSVSYNGGKGGYSYGYITLIGGKDIFICVGGRGEDAKDPTVAQSGGYNGGGNGQYVTLKNCNNASGGGATHVAITNNRGVLSNYNAYQSEIILVAGGGGGGGKHNDINYGETGEYGYGGNGGGKDGSSGTDVAGRFVSYIPGSGGTQTSGGTNSEGINGTFGQGGNGTSITSGWSGGSGGGGGWYGGASGYTNSGAGGGSGYIGGVINGETLSGDSSMPAPAGGTETGHLGNGYARITFISAN